MEEKDKIRSNIRIVAAGLLTAVVILTVMIIYTKKQDEKLLNQAKYSVSLDTQKVSELIESSIGYALSSIQLTSKGVSNLMRGVTLDEPGEILKFYQGKTPFDNVEYIRADGLNMTDAGEPFDASGRVYYIQGISGNTGIWINYHPRYSDEPLLNVYTPLYYGGAIVGVLTGTIGANNRIRPYLIDSFYEQKIYGILIDENGLVISCTEEFEPGVSLNLDQFIQEEATKLIFQEVIDSAEEQAVQLSDGKNSLILSVARVKNTGWKVIHIIPEASTRVLLHRTNNDAYFAIGLVLAMMAGLFLVVLGENYHLSRQKEAMLRFESNTDELTRCWNRHAFEKDLEELRSGEPREDLIYLAADVNELKITNDTLGHSAGDELLRGAAEILRESFRENGKVYRTGGDEFVCMIYADEKSMKAMLRKMEEYIDRWKGYQSDFLSVAFGYVSRRERPDVTLQEMAELAEQRMYESKTRYYRNKGIDRRGQQAAHTALCARYTKILKVNLTRDTYYIVNMDNSEQTVEKGFSARISSWLSDFGTSGQVHPEDLAYYLEKTNRDYLMNYFREGNDSISIIYRRRIAEDYQRVVMELIPSDDYDHEEQKLFLYVKTIAI